MLMEAWGAAKQAGPFATMIMFALWWLERRERLKLQGERDALLTSVLNSLNDFKTALLKLRLVFGGRSDE